jgi:hypothetical protein
VQGLVVRVQLSAAGTAVAAPVAAGECVVVSAKRASRAGLLEGHATALLHADSEECGGCGASFTMRHACTFTGQVTQPTWRFCCNQSDGLGWFRIVLW